MKVSEEGDLNRRIQQQVNVFSMPLSSHLPKLTNDPK